MDLADLKRLANAAREFSVSVGPQDAQRHITLRLPTQHEVVLAARRAGLHQMTDDKAATVVLQRSLLLLAVVAWSGVVAGDVLPDHPQASDALEVSPDAVQLVIDAQPEWERALGDALVQRMAERKAVKDSAEKN